MKLEQAIGFKKEAAMFQPDAVLPLPTELMGIELEYEGLGREHREGGTAPNLWTAVGDGSLRNGGVEYIFSTPIYGTGVTNALSNMSTFIETAQPQVTERCSVHVHLNVSDMEVDQLLRLIVLYLIFERTIIKYHGSTREHNIFCIPYYKAPEPLNNLMHMFESSNNVSASHVRDHLGTFNKYYGLNIGAVLSHGSLEFRHMAGSTDMSSVLDWVCIIQRLKQAAIEMDTGYMDIIDNISGNSSFITEEVFRSHADLLTPRLMVDDIVRGARLAQSIVCGNIISNATEKERSRRRSKATTDKLDKIKGKAMTKGSKKEKAASEDVAFFSDQDIVASLQTRQGENRIAIDIERWMESHRERVEESGGTE